MVQHELDNFEPEISGSGNFEENVQAQRLAENLALNKIPLVRAPLSESTIIKRKNFGRQEERRSASIIDTMKRNKIEKPTLKTSKAKAIGKNVAEIQKKSETLSAGALLPKTAVKEKSSEVNGTSVSSVEGTIHHEMKCAIFSSVPQQINREPQESPNHSYIYISLAFHLE